VSHNKIALRRVVRMVEELAAMLVDELTAAPNEDAAFEIPKMGKFLAGLRDRIPTTGGGGDHNPSAMDVDVDGPYEYTGIEYDGPPFLSPRPTGGPVGTDPTNMEPADEGVYAIPGPPPTERRVIDRDGAKWLRTSDGNFVLLNVDDGRPTSMTAEWGALIATYGPFHLDPLTDKEKADVVLYGPPGSRWGDPDKYCPFYGCTLGWMHILDHKDADGNSLGMTEADGSTASAGITPQAAAEHPCTCNHPTKHLPGCERYERMTGPVPDDVDQPDPDPVHWDV